MTSPVDQPAQDDKFGHGDDSMAAAADEEAH